MIVMEPIAYVRNGRATREDDYWGDVESAVILTDAVTPDAIVGIETFSHAEILYFLDRVDARTVARGARHPRGRPDWPRVGIFAPRGSVRPNRIASTIVRVLGREDRTIRVAELDAVDNTPVLDIKPVYQEFLPRTPLRQPAWSHELMDHYWTSHTLRPSGDASEGPGRPA